MKYVGIKNRDIVKGNLGGGVGDAAEALSIADNLKKNGVTPVIIEKDDFIHVEHRVPKRAVYAGSFDPLTFGHLWVIRYGLSLFDELIVAIADNPEKTYTFSLEERIEMLNKSLIDEDGLYHSISYSDTGSIRWLGSTLEICHIGNKFLIDFTSQKDARFILRGLRNVKDFSSELEMAHFNSDPEMGRAMIKTVWAPCPKRFTGLSSSFVKGLCGPDCWEERVQQMVPPVVFDKLVEWKSKG